LVINAKTTEVQ